MEPKYSIDFEHTSRLFQLKYHDLTTKKEMATVILYFQDAIREYLGTDKVHFEVDGEEAGPGEILDNLESKLSVVTENEIVPEDSLDKFVMYVNKKNQLIKVTKRKRDPTSSAATRDMKEFHEILSFDIHKLPHRKAHSIDSDDYVTESFFKMPLPVIKTTMYEEDKKEEDFEDPDEVPKARKKVPIKDGISQQKFILESMGKAAVTKTPGAKYYTMEEVAKHKKADDCWTVWQGKVYDITSYVKSHPGGKKIMAGAGKDCTELFNKYHHWVNANFIIGKLQIGVLKY
ncbi:unnamed protein product [Moneuplotes crassus]|uniref:Cytochrome b5 heme-binding domain-containing protein n=1 Tax=Euplotes crassus TaxID=5936 RepID=A0AAD1XR04_EUPCR|nr:unnamed protein product [Moneuplotes crassus]